MRRFKQITGIVLVAMMALSVAGCGKNELETIEDYGSTSQESVSSPEDPKQAELEKAIEENATDSQGLIFGECIDEFQAGSIKVTRNITDHGESYMSIPTFKAEKVTVENLDAEGYAKKLFGDTARQLSFKPRNPDNLRSWEQEPSREDIVFSEEEYWEQRDEREDTWFAYEGTYSGKEYYLLVTYESESGIAGLEMFPKNAGDIIGEGKLAYVTQYDPAYFEIPNVYEAGSNILLCERYGYIQDDGEILQMDKETGPEYDLRKNMPVYENRCQFSSSQLENRAKDFFEGTLDIKISEYPVKANCSNRFYEYYLDLGLDEEDQDESEKSDKTGDMVELVFSSDNNFPDIDYNSTVIDGYSVGIYPVLDQIYLPGSYTDFGYYMGHIDIAEEGIVGFNFRWKYLIKGRLSDDSALLEFENVMECMKKEVTSSEVFANLLVSNIAFNDMNITYEVLESPDKMDEVTFVPALSFYGMSDGITKYEITLNAIDGSVIEESEISY